MKKTFVLLSCLIISFAVSAQITVGSLAPEITLPDATGKMVSLSSFKGKVVLIDFWASWCKPCRASIPSVIKLQKKYQSKNFEVFGVSIDSKKKAWLGAIKKDKITQPNPPLKLPTPKVKLRRKFNIPGSIANVQFRPP